jgi:hypothetical protein
VGQAALHQHERRRPARRPGALHARRRGLVHLHGQGPAARPGARLPGGRPDGRRHPQVVEHGQQRLEDHLPCRGPQDDHVSGHGPGDPGRALPHARLAPDPGGRPRGRRPPQRLRLPRPLRTRDPAPGRLRPVAATWPRTACPPRSTGPRTWWCAPARTGTNAPSR